MYKLGRKSMSNLVGVHPEVAFACTEAIKITKQDFTIFQGVRTLEQQREMVRRGASKTMDSYHLYGLAVDLVAYVGGSVRFEVKPNKVVYEAVKEVVKTHGLAIENGDDMWGWDLYHWQLSGYKDEYDIRKLKVKV